MVPPRVHWQTNLAPHPLQHVIRPHHIVLLGVILWVFHPYDYSLGLSNRYLLHVHRFLINEMSEMKEPKSFEELIQALDKGRNVVPDDNDKLLQRIRALPQGLSEAHLLYEFFLDLPALWSPTDDDENPEPFERRSFFGLFARRAWVTFRKLSFLGLTSLLNDFQAWAAGDQHRGYDRVARDVIREDNLLVRPQCDKDAYAEPESYAKFEKAQANGDHQMAAENLRRFFEQRFSDNTDSDLRQHAMLNLVRMYIGSNQYPAARKYLLEAITVARTSNDNIVLQQCMALLRRIEGRTEMRKEPLNEIQADIPPLEVLNDVGKLLRENQPLSDSFEKIVQSLGIYDLSRDFRGGPPNQHDQWSFHAVQSVLWRGAGCERLAIIEENIVLAFCGSGGSDDSRFKMLLNRAAQLSRQGKEDESLITLLDPETWRGLDYSLHQVADWAGEIWKTMLFLASRRGQQRQVNEFLRPRKPVAFYAWSNYSFAQLDKRSVAPLAEAQLYRALQLRHVSQPVASIDHILKALWQSEYQSRFPLYRLAIVLLADAGLEFGMTVWSRKLIEEILPQVISGDDIELRAFACYVLARCIIVCCGKNYERLREALPYLRMAEDDYRSIGIHRAVQDVLYVTSVVYHNLGMVSERDDAAARHIEAVKENERLESLDVNDNWDEIWNLACEVSAALTLRK